MHESIHNIFKKWYDINKPFNSVAELGSLNINGDVRDIITDKFTGFDIVEGKGVDVVLKDFQIPEEHKNKYDLVISFGSFQFCEDTQAYVKEITDLLTHNGILFLAMCSNKCTHRHNEHGLKDYYRFNTAQLADIFKKHFASLQFWEDNLDLWMIGTR